MLPGLALGAGVELTKRAVGLSAQKTLADSFVDTSVVLNPANAKRIVDTLCKVRGAALKLGQVALSVMGHSRTYQPKLHHYVANIDDFWFIGDIYDEN